MPLRGGEWQTLMSSSALRKMQMFSLRLEDPATVQHGHLTTVPTIPRQTAHGTEILWL